MTSSDNLLPNPRVHDLRLPDWGPYSKKYCGISHLPDLKSGLRFDLSVFPGYYRRQILVPNAKWESGYHPWEAAPNLTYYAYRFELEWKDQVYCDVSFSAMGENARLVRSEMFNRTAQPQNLVLHHMAYLNFPPVRTYSDEAVLPSRAQLPAGAIWLDALDYDDLGFAEPRPQDTLVYDGLWRGEARGHGFVNGTGIGSGFGYNAGDWAEYTFRLDHDMPDAVLLLRARTAQGDLTFTIEGFHRQSLTLPQREEFTLTALNLGHIAEGSHTLRITSQGGAAVEIDGWVLSPRAVQNEVRFEPVAWQHVPEILPGPNDKTLILKYADTDSYYGLAWLGDPWEIRQLFHDELDRFLRHYVQEHVRKTLVGNNQGHFTNVFVRPIEVLPNQSKVLYSMVCSGSRAEVEQALREFPTDPQTLEGIYRRARTDSARPESTLAGEAYRFSQERMAATVLTNVVYPVYTRRSFIRHYTPGKWWDCLYTWDSGFIGLGLLELDIERAIDCLNAYTTPPGDAQAAFIHHGSMVPVQHYLFAELWNRTQDRELLNYFYPRLRQYYRFFAGRLGSSTTRRMKSNLLKTWDYFYNSGGWDDYPPQVYVHKHGLEDTVTPVISTSHGIRIAKLMQMAAQAVGETADHTEYQADIDTWTAALNRYSWDEEAGYFGYVQHSPEGEPLSIVRHESGQNYNMGLDGSSPFFAGVCTPQQAQIILERMSSPDHMWTPIGVSTVDFKANYYRVDGYWNGAVWFPQQWFFWKALLAQGMAGFARQIAQASLDVWKAEVDNSYHCFEHFIVQSGRGAGWHQFSGLSTPVLSWFGAYHRPGRLTAGFDTWIRQQQFSDNNRRLVAELENHAPGDCTVIATMAQSGAYQATWNGQPVPFHQPYPGVLEISLPPGTKQGRLEINPQ